MKRNQILPHLNDFADSLNFESDRGCVLIACHVLDGSLEHRIRTQFVKRQAVLQKAVQPLFGPARPLSSFWAKTNLAYALSLLDDWAYDDLETIRKIRNTIAHSHGEFSFDKKETASLILGLSSTRRGIGYPNVSSKKQALRECEKLVGEFAPLSKSLNRSYFVAGFHFLNGYLTKGKAYRRTPAPLK